VITRLVSKPQREVVIGAEAKRSIMQYLMAPNRYERKHSWLFPQKHLSGDNSAGGKGNLYETTHPHAVEGGWATEQPQVIKAAAPWLVAAGVVVAVGGLATWLLWSKPKTTQTE
jgi:hypothetical protein